MFTGPPPFPCTRYHTPVVVLCPDQGLADGLVWLAAPAFPCPTRSMVSVLMTTGSLGGPVGVPSVEPILSTSSTPPTTGPKMVCLPFRWGVGTCVMKNWLPFVFGPELAM